MREIRHSTFNPVLAHLTDAEDILVEVLSPLREDPVGFRLEGEEVLVITELEARWTCKLTVIDVQRLRLGHQLRTDGIRSTEVIVESGVIEVHVR